MDEIEERSPHRHDPADPTDLVARLRARLAEHEPEPRGRFDLTGRARDRARAAAHGNHATAHHEAGPRRIDRGRRRLRRPRSWLPSWLLACRDHRRGSRRSPRRRRPWRARPQPAAPATGTDTASDLLARLPTAWRATCRAAAESPGPRPRAALACTPAAGIRVDVRRAQAGSTARLVAQLATGNPPGPGGATSARDRDGLRDWSGSAHPERVLGRVACVRSHGQARLVWSVDHDSLVLDATRPDGDLARLFAWWVASTF